MDKYSADMKSIEAANESLKMEMVEYHAEVFVPIFHVIVQTPERLLRKKRVSKLLSASITVLSAALNLIQKVEEDEEFLNSMTPPIEVVEEGVKRKLEEAWA